MRDAPDFKEADDYLSKICRELRWLERNLGHPDAGHTISELWRMLPRVRSFVRSTEPGFKWCEWDENNEGM